MEAVGMDAAARTRYLWGRIPPDDGPPAHMR